MSAALLEAFAEAYNRHDIEALLALVTEDCVFEMAAGPEAFGARSSGKVALRETLGWAWRYWPDASWNDAMSSPATAASANGPSAGRIATEGSPRCAAWTSS
jgi:hypothetical protein